MRKTNSLSCLFLLLALAGGLTVFAPAANAACTSPAGAAGEIVYNADYNMMQYCDATDDWVQMSAGYVPNAMNFDGTNDWLTHGSAPAGVTDGKTMTASFWIRRPSTGNPDLIFTVGDNVFVQITSSNQLEINAKNSGATEILNLRVAGVASATNTWHHIMFSFDMANSANNRVYVNGVNQTLSYVTNINDTIDFTGANYAIGAFAGGSNKFIGDLADLWVDINGFTDLSDPDNRAKFYYNGNPVFLGFDGSIPTETAPEIFLSGPSSAWHTNKGTGGGFTVNGALTASTASPPVTTGGDFTTGLIGHWKLDETSGTTAADSAGSNTGTMAGGLSASNDSKTGVRDSALRFDGTDDRIDTGFASDLSLYTVSAWVKADADSSTASYSKIVDRDTNFSMNWNHMGTPASCEHYDGAWQMAGAAGLKGQTWYHMTCTYDGTDIRLYVNGVEANSIAAAASTSTAASILIGAAFSWTPDAFFAGVIDDVRLYNRALSANDIKALYLNSGKFCTSPNGAAGETHFNADKNTMMFCAGGTWLSMDGRYRPEGVAFDGTNDWLNWTTMMTGISDSKTFSGSFWYKNPGIGSEKILQNTSAQFMILLHDWGVGPRLQLFARNPASTVILQYEVDAPEDDKWHHVLFSFDQADPSANRVYIDGVLKSAYLYGPGTPIDDVIDFTQSDWWVGTSTQRFSGQLADLWWEAGLYIDFSVAANRRKFVSDSGMPVYLGHDGSLPTGAAPDIFMSGPVGAWHTNKGTGGGFTLSGALEETATRPPELDGGDTTDPCHPDNTPAAGDDCLDGSVYVGLTPDGNAHMFTTPCDVGMEWSGSACTGSRVGLPFNDGTTNWQDSGLVNFSSSTGESNTATLVSEDSTWVAGFQDHTAAKECYDLHAHGKDDWYLPAHDEFYVMESGKAAIGNFESTGNWTAGFYWTSTEISDSLAKTIRILLGDAADANKDSPLSVRCVRKGYVPYCTAPSKPQGTMIFNTDDNVMQFCNGGEWVGIGK